jgi:ribosomal protein S18 acetylase RimI-like enzyme
MRIAATGVHVLDFEPRDWDGVFAAYRSHHSHRPVPPSGEARLATWIDALRRRGPNVVARLDDRSVGHAALVTYGVDSYGLVVVVHARYQGLGLGRTLAGTLLRRLPTSTGARVSVRVDERNAPMIALCRRLQFRHVGTAESGAQTWVLHRRDVKDAGSCESVPRTA